MFNTENGIDLIPNVFLFSDPWSSHRSGLQLQLLETNAPESILAFSGYED